MPQHDVYETRASLPGAVPTTASAPGSGPERRRLLPPPDPASAVAALLAAHDLREPGMLEHVERVTQLALDLTSVVDSTLAACSGIHHAYALHDIGMLAIPDEILVKSDALTRTQLRLMQTHTTVGEQLVDRLRFLPAVVREVVGCHHERWDGSGYPRQLAGPKIPLAARIVAVVDAFDAMTHDRPYRDALPEPWALAELDRCAGTHFDPDLVEAFLSMEDGSPAPKAS